jgi:hypothetical protein
MLENLAKRSNNAEVYVTDFAVESSIKNSIDNINIYRFL